MDFQPDRFYYSSPGGPQVATYPKWKYHKTEPPKQVANAEQETALGPEWGDTYIKQDYPKMKFGAKFAENKNDYIVVNSPEDEGKLQGGPWSDTPPKPKEEDESKAKEDPKKK